MKAIFTRIFPRGKTDILSIVYTLCNKNEMELPANEFVSHLKRSQIYRDYKRAFFLATELPLTLRPASGWLSPKIHNSNSPACAILSASGEACADCRYKQPSPNLFPSANNKPATCLAGLSHSAVPVLIGQKLIGFLQTSRVAFQAPTREKFEQIVKRTLKSRGSVDIKRLEHAYFHCRVISRRRHAGIMLLLEIFASHLSSIGNQLMIHEEAAESPFARRAKAFVEEHQTEPISLQEIAQALHVSTFHFCKRFKKATGLTLTDYVGRVRIERAKKLLLNPNHRISEVGYEVGFGSLTHFNRLFRRLVGMSPTRYREASTHPEQTLPKERLSRSRIDPQKTNHVQRKPPLPNPRWLLDKIRVASRREEVHIGDESSNKI